MPSSLGKRFLLAQTAYVHLDASMRVARCTCLDLNRADPSCPREQMPPFAQRVSLCKGKFGLPNFQRRISVFFLSEIDGMAANSNAVARLPQS